MMNREYSPQNNFERRDQKAADLPLNYNQDYNSRGQNQTFLPN